MSWDLKLQQVMNKSMEILRNNMKSVCTMQEINETTNSFRTYRFFICSTHGLDTKDLCVYQQLFTIEKLFS